MIEVIMHRFIIVFTLFALSSCRYIPGDPAASNNYPPNISTIIEANCLGGDCHSGSTDLNYHFDLSSWDAMTKGSIYFNEIIPFSVLKSHFFGHINTDSTVAPIILPTMPLARNPLSPADQKTFFDWIAHGAQSANGEIPYSGVTKKIFVIGKSEDMFSVIDGNTQRIVRIERVGDTGISYQPNAIAMMPDRSSFIIGMPGAKGLVRK